MNLRSKRKIIKMLIKRSSLSLCVTRWKEGLCKIPRNTKTHKRYCGTHWPSSSQLNFPRPPWLVVVCLNATRRLPSLSAFTTHGTDEFSPGCRRLPPQLAGQQGAYGDPRIGTVSRPQLAAIQQLLTGLGQVDLLHGKISSAPEGVSVVKN